MIKLQDIKLTKDSLLLVFCVLGTVAVAWWAYAAGPVQSRTTLNAAPHTDTAQGLGTPDYSGAANAPDSVSSVSSGSVGSVSSGSAGTGSASSPVYSQPVPPVDEPLYPVDPPPYLCKPLTGVQTYMKCPYCGAAYPCCPYLGGAQSTCVCGGYGTEMLCASPL